jgi:hypothetical protein
MKQVRNFKDEVLAASGLKLDYRFKKWVKWIDAVDESATNGYAFVGDFVKDGTIEVEIGQPRLLLAQATSGSAKYHYAYYAVVRLNPDGSLEAVGITDNDEKKGWALRMRGAISALLAEISGESINNPLAQFSTEELVAEISRRKEEV